jgi:hypothetical protein
LRDEQHNNKDRIAVMAKDLETIKVADRSVLRSKTNQLELAVSTYEVKGAKLKSLENLLAAKRQTVDTSHQKLAAMKEQRDELFVTVAKLENRKELVDIKTQQSTIQVSDSKINECKTLAKKIDDLLSEREMKSEIMDKYYPEDGKATAEKDSKPTAAVLDRAKKVLQEQDGNDQ